MTVHCKNCKLTAEDAAGGACDALAGPEHQWYEAQTQSPLAKSQAEIADVCDMIRDKLLEKNRAYGDSALDPVRIFSKAAPDEQINVRLDDKLSRLKRGFTFADEDTIFDLVGYLILKLVLRRRTAGVGG